MINPGFDYASCIKNSEKVAWKLDDVLPPDTRLDFGRPFLPDAFTGASAIPWLDARGRLLLNQINGNAYMNLFAFVEEYIIAVALEHAHAEMFGDHVATRALVRFAEEELKHQALFQRYHEMFERDFPHKCGVLGSAAEVAGVILGKRPIAVMLVTLHLEIMTQAHFTESVRDDAGLDPLFVSMLKHHWLEEAQHAKIDHLELLKLCDVATPEQLREAFDDYLGLIDAFDGLLQAQAKMDVESLATALGRPLSEAERDDVMKAQHSGYRRTFLTYGMNHRQFAQVLSSLSDDAAARVAQKAASLG